MKASIIIRAYNARRTIEKALSSALLQTFRNSEYEIIVVDDGSVDNTKKILTKYSDNNLRIITQKRKGATAALNKGIRISKGQYIVALDADDIFEKDLLSTEIKKIESDSNVDFVYCNYWEKYDNHPKKLINATNPFEAVLVGTLFKKNRLKSVGNFREDIYFAEYDLFLRTLNIWRSERVSRSLFTYYRGLTSLTANFEKVVNGIEQLKNLHPGKEIYIKKIRSYLILDKIQIKKAAISDSNTLLHLRNLKQVRRYFFNTRKIRTTEHNRWFTEKLKDPNCRIYVLVVDSKPIGQIRYELENGICEVDISIHPKFSGFGIGTYVLKKTSANEFLKFDRVNKFTAHIKLGNIASQKALEKAGFKNRGIAKFKNINCVEFEKRSK